MNERFEKKVMLCLPQQLRDVEILKHLFSYCTSLIDIDNDLII